MPINNEIVYPKFLECCEFTTDNFWKYIFEDLAYGKTPYGTYITKNFLCCNYKGKDFSYKIDNKKSAETIYNDIYNILYKKFGLLSENEKLRKRENFDKKEKEIKSLNNSWQMIKKKNIKNIIIENYVLNMKKKYSLDNKKTKQLLSIIIIGLILKTINSNDIEYKNNKIINIKGIHFETNSIILDNDIYNFSLNNSADIIEKKIMSENWDKFINNLIKQQI